MANTTFIADLSSITSVNAKTNEAVEVFTRVDAKGFSYVHIATNDKTTVTTIRAENVPAGKIMILKYRLCNGYYPNGHFGVNVYYFNDKDVKKHVVGTPSGGIRNTELVKRHRGWVVGRVNAQTAVGNAGFWTNDNTVFTAKSIEVEIAHKDDLDIAYFMTDHKNINLLPEVKAAGDEYYMHQELTFGCFIKDQWRKINAAMDNGSKQADPFTPPGLPEHPEEPDPVFYEVSFNLNGYGAAIDSKTVLGGRKVSRPDDPTTVEPYHFDGWCIDAEGIRQYNFNTPVNKNLVLYARWAEFSIAEMLQVIAENTQKVYDAAYDTFWDVYQQNGKRGSYYYAFAGIGWNESTFKPKYDIKPISTLHMFSDTAIVDVPACLRAAHIELDTSNVGGSGYLAQSSDYLEVLPVISIANRKNVDHFIYDCGKLRIIEKIILKNDGSQSFNGYSFGKLPSLKEIRFEGVIGKSGLDIKESTQLSKESITSIRDALSRETTGLSITLSLAAINKAFETSPGANDGSSSKEWIQEYYGQLNNWTVSLM